MSEEKKEEMPGSGSKEYAELEYYPEDYNARIKLLYDIDMSLRRIATALEKSS